MEANHEDGRAVHAQFVRLQVESRYLCIGHWRERLVDQVLARLLHMRGDAVIDLTRKAFLSLHSNISDGRIPVRVYYDY